MDETQNRIGNIWSERYSTPKASARTSWNKSAAVVAYVAEKICGRPCKSVQEANISLLRKLAGERKNYSRGISVACGTGKEMLLLESGPVAHFDCWELSETAITAGKEEAKKRGLEERISFHYGDVFSNDVSSGKFDLVYWDNAMHHMFDTGQAMRWSRDALADSGVFYMYDYVGPTRFQWRDEQMEIVKNVLESWMTNIF